MNENFCSGSWLKPAGLQSLHFKKKAAPPERCERMAALFELPSCHFLRGFYRFLQFRLKVFFFFLENLDFFYHSWPEISNMDERTPLLENDSGKVDLLYDRFSPEKKRLIVAIVSWGGLVPCQCLLPLVINLS